MSTGNRLTVGRTKAGYRIALEGRGTLFQCPAFQELVDHCFRDKSATVVVDLSACAYLDSTFLGCLVNLHGRYNGDAQARLAVYAPSKTRCELLRRSGLDHFFTFTNETPTLLGESAEIEASTPDRDVLGRQVQDAHRRLAEFGGREAAAFDEIARHVANELREDPRRE